MDPDIQLVNLHTEMRVTSLPVWLAFATSTSAFSAVPRKYQRISTSALNGISRGQPKVGKSGSNSTSALHYIKPFGVADMELPVADTELPVGDMERGMGGRLESAFESAKEKREAAFVAFMTAGYPKAEGTFVYFAQNIRVDRISRL